MNSRCLVLPGRRGLEYVDSWLSSVSVNSFQLVLRDKAANFYSREPGQSAGVDLT